MLVAIHQPNFFPWLGYFNKILQSDVFVFMDDVAYHKSGSGMGTWGNRVQILVQGAPMWIGCPIVREHGVQMIKNLKIKSEISWQVKCLKTIEYNYKKSPFFEENWEWFKSMLLRETESLSEYNIANIKEILRKLGIQKPFVVQSELGTVSHSTDVLIEIAKKIGGNSYLCGGGALGYQEDDKFAAVGIELVYQNFKHPVYQQKGMVQFVPGLSIIDALMNCGIEGTKTLLA